MLVDALYTLLENLTEISPEKTNSARSMLHFLIQNQFEKSHRVANYFNEQTGKTEEKVYHLYLPSSVKTILAE